MSRSPAPQAPAVFPEDHPHTVDAVAELDDCSRTFLYAEMNAGRLKAHKRGRNTIIFERDRRAWHATFPAYQPSAA